MKKLTNYTFAKLILICSIFFIFLSCSETNKYKLLNDEIMLLLPYQEKEEDLIVFLISEMDCESCLSNIQHWLSLSKNQYKPFGICYSSNSKNNRIYEKVKKEIAIPWVFTHNRDVFLKVVKETDFGTPLALKIENGNITSIKNIKYESYK